MVETSAQTSFRYSPVSFCPPQTGGKTHWEGGRGGRGREQEQSFGFIVMLVCLTVTSNLTLGAVLKYYYGRNFYRIAIS
jgi:hypothetical protein